MALSIGEFLHPLKSASQRDLVLAAMYYLARYESKTQVTTDDIGNAFKRAKHTKGRKIAYAAVLTQAVPFVESPGIKEGRHLLWSLTGRGEDRVRELLGLPAAEPEIEHDVGTLQALAGTVGDENARGYIEEALVCLRSGALRAAVVFLWTGAVATIRDEVWAHGAVAIEKSLKSHNPKARDFTKKGDFSYVNDATLLQIAQDLGAVDKTEKQRLEEALNLRNGCGHPTKYSPGVKKASAFVEDVVGIVWG
jgi:hypothetical protein